MFPNRIVSVLQPGLAKSKYRRFSRPTSTAMHKRRPKNQAGLNCNVSVLQFRPSETQCVFVLGNVQKTEFL